jgi:P4 family phage/plasmid primase-like protien
MPTTFHTIQYCIHNSIPCFSFDIKWDTTTNTKTLHFPKEWQKLKKPQIKEHKNGLALLTGVTFWVLDLDNCFEELPQDIQTLLMTECQTIVQTRRGYHFYFKVCDTSKEFKSKSAVFFIDKKREGVDIRGTDGCIIAPPSSYFDGTMKVYTYEWIKGDLSSISYASNELLQLFQENKTEHLVSRGMSTVQDDWNSIVHVVTMLSCERATNYSDWISVIWALKNTEHSERSLDLAHEFSRRTLKMNQYNPSEVTKIFETGKQGYTRASLFYWAMKDNPDEYFSRFGMSQLEENVFNGDSGLAELYALENRNHVVCTSQHTSTLEFYIYDDATSLWKESSGNDIKRHFSLTMEGILLPLHKYYTHKINSATQTEQENLWVAKRFALAKIMKHTHNNACAKNVLPYISSVLYDKDFFIKLNKTPYLLSVANGVVDLRTSQLSKRDASHYFSYALQIHYNPAAELKDWNKYFNQVFQNDQEVIEWLQTYLGYTLSGETNLQRVVVLWGSGSNSKSILLGFLRKIMGVDLFQTLSLDDIRSKDGGSRDGLYQARNARMAILSETSAHAKFDEEILKSISGQDPISVSAKYKNQITYIPQFKFYIITNNRPHFDPEKGAIWRRIILVPFETAFKDIDSPDWNEDLAKAGKMIAKDDGFLNSLNNNLEGLLRWMIVGAKKYYTTSEKIPKKLVEANQKYKKSCNIYLNWLEQNYEKSEDTTHYITSDDLIFEWKKDNPRVRENDKAISMKLSEALKEWELVKERKRINKELCYVYGSLKRKGDTDDEVEDDCSNCSNLPPLFLKSPED